MSGACGTCGGVHRPGALGPVTAPRPETDNQQQAAAEVLRLIDLAGGARDAREAVIAAYLAEAARPGQELRERIEALTDEVHLPGYVSLDRIRAALEDPR